MSERTKTAFSVYEKTLNELLGVPGVKRDLAESVALSAAAKALTPQDLLQKGFQVGIDVTKAVIQSQILTH